MVVVMVLNLITNSILSRLKHFLGVSKCAAQAEILLKLDLHHQIDHSPELVKA
jgi:hypothetical protein